MTAVQCYLLTFGWAFFLAFNQRAELTSKVGENRSVSGASPKLICIGGSRLYPHGEEHRGTSRVSQHCIKPAGKGRLAFSTQIGSGQTDPQERGGHRQGTRL